MGLDELLDPIRAFVRGGARYMAPTLQEGPEHISKPGILGLSGIGAIPAALSHLFQYTSPFEGGLARLLSNIMPNVRGRLAPIENPFTYRIDEPDQETLRRYQEQLWEEYLRQPEELTPPPGDDYEYWWTEPRRWSTH